MTQGAPIPPEHALERERGGGRTAPLPAAAEGGAPGAQAKGGVYHFPLVRDASNPSMPSEDLLDQLAQGGITDGYEMQRSLFCLSPDNAFRRACIATIRHPMFDRAVLLAILLNCIQMATLDPLLDRTGELYAATQRNNFYFNTVLTALFTAEFGVKVVAMGFVLHRGAYLRDRWNWIDFVCVLSGWIDLASTWVGDGGSGASVLTSLRAVRVLRPLRTLTKLPGMQELITSMLASIPQLSNVVGILLFFLVLFGILGVQLLGGKLRHQCWAADDDGVWASTEDVCNPFGDPLTYSCPPPAECRCGASGLPPNVSLDASGASRSACVEADNPNNGMNHFDHLWAAVITLFQAITLEGWTDDMYRAQDGAGNFLWIYFVLAIAFGAFLIVQLFLAVLSEAFDAENDKRRREARTHEQGTEAEQKKGAADQDGDGVIDLDMTGRPWLQRRCYGLVTAQAFRYSMHLAIVLNTVVMCCEYHNQPEREQRVLTWFNYALTLVFTLELIAQLIALGARNYLRDTFNRFDGLVVLLSVVDVALDLADVGFVNLAVLRTFRLVRLVRVFKLLRSFEGLNKLLRSLVGSVRSVSSLTTLLLLLVLIYALLGLELFGGIYTAPPMGRNDHYDGDEVPANNFDTFAMACISIFVVLSGENWNEVYGDTAHGLQTLYGSPAARELATFYFFSLFLLGNFVVFNLFIAIILSNIEAAGEDAAEEAASAWARGVDAPGKIVFAFGGFYHVRDEHAERVLKGAGSRAALHKLDVRPLEGSARSPNPRGQRSSVRQYVSNAIAKRRGSVVSSSWPTAAERAGSEGAHAASPETRHGIAGASHGDSGGPLALAVLPSFAVAPAAGAAPDAYGDRSLGVFSRSHPLRRACILLVEKPAFDNAILLLILASSISLAFDTPDQTELTTRALSALNWVFTLLFVAEMLVKVVALGFVSPAPSAYLRSAWNVLDFAIVLVSVVLLAFEVAAVGIGSQFGWLKALRVVRALRPLRVANRLAGMKKVVNSLFMALPQCGNVALLLTFFVLTYAIIGVQLFKGKFYECTDLASQTIEECAANGGRWVNFSGGNFDHVGYGILTLLEMAGLEMWPDVMFRGMHATEAGRAPMRDDRSVRVVYSLYFIVWIFAGSFILFNMFVGVVLDSFSQLRKKDDGSAFMTNEQRYWMEAQRAMYAMRPLRQAVCPSRHLVRQRVFRLTQSSAFQAAIMGAIVANALVMMLEWHDAPPAYRLSLRVLNYAFSLVFLAEMALKLVALGARQYAFDAWNAFDGILVTLSVLDLSLELAGDVVVLPVDPNLLRLLRMLRVVRLLRVVKSLKGLRTLLVTLWSSLPALQNVGLLLGLVIYMYAIAGMYIFPDVPDGDFFSRHTNFRTFWMSLLTLFRCATGESWNGIMHDAMGGDWADNAARCEAGEPCALSSVAAVIFFVSFWILGQAILLNLVIGVILENFSAIGSAADKPITVEQLEEFREEWLKYDPDGTFTIKSHQLLPILLQLSMPLGFGGKKPAVSRAQLLRLMRRIDLPDNDGRIHFMQTVTAITHAQIGVPLPLCDLTRKMAKDAERAAALGGGGDGASGAMGDDSPHSVATSYLISLLQHRYRKFAQERASKEASIGADATPSAEEHADAPAGHIGRARPAGEASCTGLAKRTQNAPAAPTN